MLYKNKNGLIGYNYFKIAVTREEKTYKVLKSI